MQAIILAAGMGKRLGTHTQDNTKCMVKVNGITLIERVLEQLNEINITRVVLVIGYKGENLKNYVGDKYKNIEIKYVDNPIYDKTNNIYSLYLAKDYLISDDTLLIESDLIFETSIFKRIANSKYENIAVVDKYKSWMDGTVVVPDKDDNIIRFVPKKHFDYKEIDKYYKTVNIYKFSKDFSKYSYIPFLEAYTSALGNNEYYEQVLRIITLLENQNLKALRLDGEKWYEIDDIQDLGNAETIFANKDDAVKSMQSRYGGYWRFPKLLDFCYLVNPYFPNETMQSEMEYSFAELMRNYPSGSNVQNLLASKMFNCEQNHIIVGNGAAELINLLMNSISGKIGVIYPTFNEYPERISQERIVKLLPKNNNFSYGISEIKELAKDVENILLINPDNPSGNIISKKEIISLLNYLKEKNKKLILDESFIDFAEGSVENSLIDSDILNLYPNLIIVKSISKSYGVPGLRLGVMCSSDRNILNKVSEKNSIWNINSFAEFFLQIIGKYQNSYISACEKIANERNRFFLELNKIDFLRVIPSQANYFTCEITKKYTSTELTYTLLTKYDIFIKDLKGKTGIKDDSYIRIAVRDSDDNNKLLKILQTL